MQITRFSRGQTIIEFVVAMPIVLLALFAIMYFSQFGVVSERAELALRYGGIAAYNMGGSQYGAANIYYNISGALPACPTPPAGILAGGGPFPGPTSAPFWQPSTDVQAPRVACTPAPYGFGGSQFIASHFWGTTRLEVSAHVDVPPYLQPAMGGANSGVVDTVTTLVHAASPGMIMYCSKEVRQRVQAAFTANGSNALPTPIPDGTQPATPPPDNGVCD
ncbi:MAG TPA: TadE family protein [Candidatus Baltobacteraceae bacterium]|nr:TadE family protein [Candidatus Baltobacteraceae bacterium]